VQSVGLTVLHLYVTLKYERRWNRPRNEKLKGLFMNRKGFAYVIAVLILGLLAFMGLFLKQSSSVEYSQAGLSVYSTMAQQIGEAAADEVFLSLEEMFRDGGTTGKKGPLLRQGKGAKFFPDNPGLNPELLDILPEFAPFVTQTNYLMSNHMTRAGFFVEKIRAKIMDYRPIDSRPINSLKCVYQPRDRKKSFNGPLALDYMLTLGLEVTVGFRQGTKSHRFLYQISRDMKIINVGPIGRNYSLFNLFGPDPRNQQTEIKTDLQLGKGRLVLWNHPYQSRVYMHGPAVVGIENPDYAPTDKPSYQFAFSRKDPKGLPGNNHAFQFSDTYNGLSYLSFPARALWEPKKLIGNNILLETKNDLAEMNESEKRMFGYNTYKKGFIPMAGTNIWQSIGSFLSSYSDSTTKDYIRGKRVKQLFLPGGPFCRFPWKYVPERTPANYSPNIIAEAWPDPDPNLRIEHRWVESDSKYHDETKIYAETLHFELVKTGDIMNAGYPQEKYPEFSLSYGNHRNPESLGGKFGEFFKKIGRASWNLVSFPARWAFTGIGAGIRAIFAPKDPSVPQGIDETNQLNLYPTNYKDFNKATTIRMRGLGDIPTDPIDGKTLILDGCYSLDSFITKGDILYRGCGIIYVGIFDRDKFPDGNVIIRGSILKDPAHRLDSHLTLVYSPTVVDKATGRESWPDFDRAQIVIEGSGRVIQASVFSMAGIRTTTGILEDDDYKALNMDPMATPKVWGEKVGRAQIDQLQSKVNSIVGNYVNGFMKKARLDGDLWIFHDVNSPFYFRDMGSNIFNIKSDYDEKDELLVHSVHLSPKIQHLFFSGAGQ